MFNRDLLEELRSWRQRPGRKPLILNGARQVGKTTLLRMLGQQEYATTIEINFDSHPEYSQIFEPNLDPRRIVSELEKLTSQHIVPEQTLVIFDEIQACPRAMTALKYFCEDAPEYSVVAAGSLLGLMLHQGSGYPVGKVDTLNLYPLSFTEFCTAVSSRLSRDDLATVSQEGSARDLQLLKTDLVSALRLYYVVGGMPEAVANYATGRDLSEVRHTQNTLVESYLRDINKHAQVFDREPIVSVWRMIPEFLGRENKKFIFGQVTPGRRARDFAGALTWMREAGLIYQVNRVSRPGLPLSAYQKDGQFKVFTLDVGLLGAISGLPTSAASAGNPLFTEFKGALTEQYVAQQLQVLDDTTPHYWSAENSSGEIDFLRQEEGRIFSIEVKAEENLRSKSLQTFTRKYPEIQAVRTSMSDYRAEENLCNIPLFALHNQTLWPNGRGGGESRETSGESADLYL